MLIYAEPGGLPFKPGSIDEIIVCPSYAFMSNFDQVIKSLSGLLKFEGVLTIIDAESTEFLASFTNTRVEHFYITSPNDTDYFA